MNKKISTPIGIGIILILAVLVGEYTLWQFSEIQKEEIGPISLENKKQTTDFEETAQNLFSDYLDKYKNTDVSLNDRIKSYMINDIKIDTIEDNCFRFTVNYSVETFKDQNNNWTNWVAGNGKEEGNWVKNKTNFVDVVKENGNYKIREMGTGRSSASCMGEQNGTADWKTYRNEEYGFEIKYPSEGRIENETTTKEQLFSIGILQFFAASEFRNAGEEKIINLVVEKKPSDLSSLETYLNALTIKNNTELRSEDEGTGMAGSYSVESQTLGDKKTLTLVFRSAGGNSGAIGNTRVDFYFENSSYFIIASYGYSQFKLDHGVEEEIDRYNTTHQILSTFKSLE